MKFIKTEIIELINQFRADLYQSFNAPIDAMWEKLYIVSSQHYLIENEDIVIGFCCIDENGSLLQIHLIETSKHLINKVISMLIQSSVIRSASLSSIEPISFNACLFHAKSIESNTLCFQYLHQTLDNTRSLNIELALTTDIPNIQTFMREQIGFDDTFGYTDNLVSRKEYYLLKESDKIIATSELRLSDTQPKVADLGVIVHQEHQRKGIATQILLSQANRALELNRKPICSTSIENIASQKAIEKAGFYCSHIIFNLHFTNE